MLVGAMDQPWDKIISFDHHQNETNGNWLLSLELVQLIMLVGAMDQPRKNGHVSPTLTT